MHPVDLAHFLKKRDRTDTHLLLVLDNRHRILSCWIEDRHALRLHPGLVHGGADDNLHERRGGRVVKAMDC